MAADGGEVGWRWGLLAVGRGGMLGVLAGMLHAVALVMLSGAEGLDLVAVSVIVGTSSVAVGGMAGAAGALVQFLAAARWGERAALGATVLLLGGCAGLAHAPVGAALGAWGLRTQPALLLMGALLASLLLVVRATRVWEPYPS